MQIRKALTWPALSPFQGEILFLEDLMSLPDDALNSSLLASIRRQAADTDPLYGIFTSGSTGVPKGVVASHRSVIDFIEHFTDLFHITQDDVIGNQAPFDFDVSVKDIYSALKTGATTGNYSQRNCFPSPPAFWTTCATGKSPRPSGLFPPCASLPP